MIPRVAIPPVAIPPAARGPWRIETVEVPSGISVGAMRLAMQGRWCPPGTYTRLVHAVRGTVMSDTPAEMADHAMFVRVARGHCLINGLGLGMCLSAILQKPEVTAVTVVEIDADVIALVGPHFTDSRVAIVHSAAMDFKPPRGIRYGAVWHDIWDTICTDNLPEMHALHRKYGRRAAWQGSWCRERCEQERRSEQRYW